MTTSTARVTRSDRPARGPRRAPRGPRAPGAPRAPGPAPFAALIVAAALAACGGGESGEADPASDPAAGAPAPGVSVPAGADTTVPGAEPGRAVAPASGGTGGVEDAAGVEGEGPAGPDTAGVWAMPPLREQPAGSGRSTAILRGVRTGRHEGYDRIVFEFAEHLPEYTLRYVQSPSECGSGQPVDAGGAAPLEVDLRPAAAHDDQGNATIEQRTIRPGLPALRTARITCDFEAVVTWVLGLDHRARVRTLELDSPPRLVVDVRHR